VRGVPVKARPAAILRTGVPKIAAPHPSYCGMKLRQGVFDEPCPLPAADRATMLSRWSLATSRPPAMYPPAEEAGGLVGLSL
jgi:hypothetical protein